MYEKKKGNTYYTNRHSCFLLQYHLVLVTKYRHPVLEREIKAAAYSSIRDTFKKRGLHILEMISVVKTQSSRFVRKAYGDTLLKKWYWKPYFWSDSYFITTVSENSLTMVKEYIQNQQKK